MAFLSDNDLKFLIESENLISPYRKERIQSASYELSLGDQYYSTGDDSKLVEFLSKRNKHLVIKPGQFALLLTEETIEIPKDRIAFISIKAGIKFSGLVNISGFHVDPGFKGKLKFSVYNAGPSSIILEWKKPCFIIWFSTLTNPLSNNDVYKGSHQNQSNITNDDLNKIKGEILSPAHLSQKFEHLQSKLQTVSASLAAILIIILTIYVESCYNKLNVSQEASSKIDSTTIYKSINANLSRKIDSLSNKDYYLKKINK